MDPEPRYVAQGPRTTVYTGYDNGGYHGDEYGHYMHNNILGSKLNGYSPAPNGSSVKVNGNGTFHNGSVHDGTLPKRRPTAPFVVDKKSVMEAEYMDYPQFSRCNVCQPACIVALFFILALIAAVVTAVVFLNMGSSDTATLNGVLIIPDMTYTDSLGDPDSTLYMGTEADVCAGVENAASDSVESCEVTSFEAGSVIARFTISVRTDTVGLEVIMDLLISSEIIVGNLVGTITRLLEGDTVIVTRGPTTPGDATTADPGGGDGSTTPADVTDGNPPTTDQPVTDDTPTTPDTFPPPPSTLEPTSTEFPVDNTYDHELTLLEDVFTLSWTFDDTSITFRLVVRTLGWVGFGISPTGGMAGADMAVAWVVGGQATLKDTHGTMNGVPTTDDSQDWELVEATEDDQDTVIVLRRPLQLCNDQDLDITESTMRIIWAYSETDPNAEELSSGDYHTARGTRSLRLLSPAGPPRELPEDAFSYDILVDSAALSDASTTYWCQGYEVPTLDAVHHVIMAEPVIQEGHEALVHHILIYACDGDIPAEELDVGALCYGGALPALMECNRILFGWAVGGQQQYLPENIGQPFGGDDPVRYFRLEVHYDNPEQRNDFVDSSGMRLWLTPTLREYESHVLMAGMRVNVLQVIPPGQEEFTTVGHCTEECLRQGLADNPDGIRVFGYMLHTHLAGEAIKVRHIRDGVDLPPLAQDMTYDFNYQEFQLLDEEVIIMPGDRLVVECTYNTMERDASTYGGLSTEEEMCLAFLWYYPKLSIVYCITSPTEGQMATVVDGGQVENVEDVWTFIAPSNMVGVSLFDYLNDPSMGGSLEDVNQDGWTYDICVGDPSSAEVRMIPEAAAPYPEYNPCEDGTDELSLSLGDGQYNVSWSFDDSTITFHIIARTTGWVGFGVSGTGGMEDADMVVAWVKDGQATIQDTYADQNGAPLIDESQDWELLYANEDSESTEVTVRRFLWTCDLSDRSITADTTRVIWAFGSDDPSGDQLIGSDYHGSSRGTRSVRLLSPPGPPRVLPDDAFSVDIIVDNAALPDSSTTYWCQGYEVPALDAVHHVIMSEPVIQEGHEALVHHMLIYACDGDIPAEELDVGAPCYGGAFPTLMECSRIVFGWAVGGEQQYLPENIGQPFGGDDPVRYFRLEVHYDNPEQRNDFVDNSGMRLWLTPTLREYESHVLMAGMRVNELLVIPPGQEEFTTVGHCTEECLRQGLAEHPEGIHVFGYILHTHLAGESVKVRHIRDGVDLPPLAQDMSYDFNYQEFQLLDEEVIIMPGDRLVVECTYNTMGRDASTYGGLSTEEEMCLAFLWYYPKLSIAYCISGPTEWQMATAVDGGQVENVEDVWTFTAPSNVAGVPLYEYLSDPTMAASLEDVNQDGWTHDFCIGDVSSYEVRTIPEAAAPYPEYNPCEDGTDELSLSLGDGQYNVSWSFDDLTITFHIIARTTGWVGFGVSGTGGMTDADMVVAWVKDGEATIQDTYADQNGAPLIDESQDWELLDANEDSESTEITVRRFLWTCDLSDRSITADTTRVIWAFGSDDPSGDQLIGSDYHGSSRGTRSVRLLSPPGPPRVLPDDAFSVDIIVDNAALPDSSTTYWCRGYEVPALDAVHHVIMSEPVIQEGHEALVHHILIYACDEDIPAEELGVGAPCYGGAFPTLMACSRIVFGWAVGGEQQYLPENIGQPFGGDDPVRYFRLEIHYDNPEQRNDFVDNSGMRLWLTPTLREYESHVLMAGMDVSVRQFIPPGQEEFTTVGHCTEECLRQGLAEHPEGIHVFGYILHTHLAGESVKVRHIRDGVDLPPLAQDMSYDFNYQEFQLLDEEVIIMPGDRLVVECTYNTMGRDASTYGGLSTEEEMCLAFLWYYPKLSIAYCITSPTEGQLATAVDGGQVENVEDVWTFTAPSNVAGVPLYEYLSDPSMAASLEDVNQDGWTYDFCIGDVSSYEVRTIPEAAAPYPEYNPCEDGTDELSLSLGDGQYNVSWSFDDLTITFHIIARTTGWVGFGVSGTGGMTDADMVVAWVKDGEATIQDTYADQNGAPLIDESQDWELLDANEDSESTEITVRRFLWTCDLSDRSITADTTRVIWAFGSDDPSGDQLIGSDYHGSSRGTRSVRLLSPPGPPRILPDDAFSVDIIVDNAALPDSSTTYWCRGYEVPALDAVHHVIMSEPVIQEGHEALVHHILIYACDGDIPAEELGVGAPCYGGAFPTLMECSRIVFGWAVGGEQQYLPENIGQPFGGDDPVRYFRLEVHYDNPEQRNDFVDNSGMRLWLTPTLREYESHVLSAGMDVSVRQFIPPGQEEFTTVGHCTEECLRQGLADHPEGIHVFGYILHTHLAGESVKVRHIRDGVDLPPLAQDMSYDFNYQEFQLLDEEVIIMPGDRLVVECTYNTMERDASTYGGLSTEEEMCLAFLWYYPKLSIAYCLTSPTEGQMATAVDGGQVENVEDVWTFTAPSNVAGVPLYEYLSDPSMAASLEDVNQDGWTYDFCIGDVSSYEVRTIPEAAVPYPEQNPCEDGTDEQYSLSLGDGQYSVSWSFDDSTITFHIIARTTGWVGFGVSGTGGMKDADMVVAWVKDGEATIQDTYADHNGAPLIDESQDWELLYANEDSESTELIVRRLLWSCDPSDRNITTDTARVIWALGSDDPTGDSLVGSDYHGGSRGTRSVHLLSPPGPPRILPDDAISVDIVSDNVQLRRGHVEGHIIKNWPNQVTIIPADGPMPSSPGHQQIVIPENDTTYWCYGFEFPDIEKHHVIMVEPVIQGGNEAYVHHLVVYACDGEISVEEMAISGPCFDGRFTELATCNRAVFAWAVGVENFFFPEHVGYPVGADYPRFYRMELHYDNPNLISGQVDSSGLRLWLTPTLREFDSETMSAGMIVSPLQFIPPGQEAFTTYGHCSEECISQGLADFPDGIHVYAYALHTHLAGEAVVVRHIRDGEDLPPLAQDLSYDFNFQDFQLMREEVTILPGDRLIVECTYNTEDRSEPTLGGLGTRQEMCLVFLYYYPIASLSYCATSPSTPRLASVLDGLEMEYDFDAGDWYVTSPSYLSGQSVFTILYITTWDEELSSALEAAGRDGDVYEYCMTDVFSANFQQVIPVAGEPYHAEEEMTCYSAAPAVEHSLSLADGMYNVSWTFDDLTITFSIIARTTGWIGFGVSGTGGMTDADMVVAWVKDGEATIQDTHSEQNGAPVRDDSQDWELLYANEDSESMEIKVRRYLRLCDPNDRNITAGTSHVIWAYGSDDPDGEALVGSDYHGEDRGTQSVHILAPPGPPRVLPDDAISIDIVADNIEIPENDTTYWCFGFEFPDIEKHHVMMVEPVIQEGNEAFVHHLVFYACDVDISDEQMAVSGSCFDGRFTELAGCIRATFAWAIGGQDLYYPEHVGFPIGGDSQMKFGRMELHYDNVNMISGQLDSSGIRIWATPTLREFESNTFSAGMRVDPLHFIPPGQQSFTTYGHCSEECLSQGLADAPEGIHVYGYLLHTHLAGISVVVRHIRDGEDLPTLAQDLSYDSDYQEFHLMGAEVTILPGDRLIVECTYNTEDRSEPTLGGLGTREEMCSAFMFYYPSTSMSICLTTPSVPQLVSAFDGVEVAYEFTTGEWYTTSPQYLFGQSVFTALYAANWDQQLSATLEAAGRDGGAYEYCLTDQFAANFERVIPVAGPPYHEEMSCYPGFPEPEGEFQLSVSLADGAYNISWTYDDSSITFYLSALTLGWIGFGISGTGGMIDADIAVAWVTDGQAVLKDTYSSAYGVPVADESQDWHLVEATEDSEKTMVTVHRYLNPCDSNDLPITADTIRLIWAYGTEDPTDDELMNINYHGETRGTLSTRLLSSPPPPTQLPDDAITFDMLADNAVIPEDDTTYWCFAAEIPDMEKHHVLKIEPIVQEGNELLVHHIVVYGCDIDIPASELELSGPCFDGLFPTLSTCYRVMFAWAVGGEDQYFPEHIGLPIGGDDLTGILRVEVHYDNPSMTSGQVDNSGLRLWMTPTLREYDAQVLMAGELSTQSQIIPPGQEAFTSYGHCSQDCINTALAATPEGIHVFGYLLHTHLAGVSVIVRHIRDGVDLPPIAQDMNYDFNYQEFHFLSEEVTILPGDRLIVECVYNTEDRSTVTYGGEGTREEMCLAFLNYYPKHSFNLCLTQPSATRLAEAVEGSSLAYENGQWVFTAPENLAGQEFFSGLETLFPDDELSGRLEAVGRDGEVLDVCYTDQTSLETIVIPEAGPPYEEAEPDCHSNNQPTITEQYTLTLGNGMFNVSWSFDDLTITFHIIARTTGWVGFGISGTGGMKDADMVVAWVIDGEAMIQDTYAEQNGAPIVDSNQDWELLFAYEDSNTTEIKVRRYLRLCDTEDRNITADTIRLIWAYGTSDPTGVEFTGSDYHGDTRGTQSVRLLSPPGPPRALPDDAISIDILADNVEIPETDTTYWCFGFEFPDIEKHHVVMVEPIVHGENEGFVHHLVLYVCDSDIPDDELSKAGLCYEDGFFNELAGCVRTLFVWAVGGQNMYYPDHVGYPIGGDAQLRFGKMELHYDNPNGISGQVDSSGLRIWMTPTLREFEAETLAAGVLVSPLHFIPPGQTSFTSYGHCSEECLSQGLADAPEGIHVFGYMLHTHLAGESIVVRHIRDGEDLPTLAQDLTYDFNYQDFQLMDQEITILPGDRLIVECTYNTEDRTEPTLGGFGTREEMCLAFLLYYPKLTMSYCATSPSVPQLASAFQDVEITYNFGDEQWYVTAPADVAGLPFFALLSASFPDDNLAAALEEVGMDGSVYDFCLADAFSVDYEQIIPEAGTPYQAEEPTCYSGFFQPEPITVTLVEGVYDLSWTFDDTSITFYITVHTHGWIGLGISATGGMRDADIMVAWVKDGQAVVKDTYSADTSVPVEDSSQDWELLEGSEDAETTYMVVRRYLRSCDPNDLNITTNTMRVIWAYGADDPTGDYLLGSNYHGSSNRGSRSLHLLNAPHPVVELPADAVSLDFIANEAQVPDADTTYWCFGVEIPTMEKHHVIKVEPVIQEGNELLVHHMLVYACDTDIPEEQLTLSGPCFDGLFAELSGCVRVLLGWAVGGEDQYFPDHVGLPIGGDEPMKFLRVEMHYDNPDMLSGLVDNSGLRVWMTPTLREFDSHIMMAGVLVTDYHMIPPGQESFISYGHCTEECINSALADTPEGIHIFSYTLHTHLAGRAIRLRHIRDGVELPPIAQDDSYDFNFQDFFLLDEEITILPGDRLIVECDYNTEDRDDMTYGGESTRDEMCLVFLNYYPRRAFSHCLSVPAAPHLISVVEGAELTFDFPTYEWLFSAPAELAGQPYTAGLATYFPDNDLSAALEVAGRDGPIYEGCLTDTYSLLERVVPDDVTEYVEEEEMCYSMGG